MGEKFRDPEEHDVDCPCEKEDYEWYERMFASECLHNLTSFQRCRLRTREREVCGVRTRARSPWCLQRPERNLQGLFRLSFDPG